MIFRRYLAHWLWLALTAFGTCAPAAHADAPADRLLQAASRGDTQQVKALLAESVPVDVRDRRGNTPLLLATAGNHAPAAEALIRAGADVNIKNQREDSAYLLAGAEGHLAILKMTLQHGADLKSTNRYGGTAMIPACERGHVEVVRTLLQAGVDPDHINRLGWTCLLEAVILGNGGPAHQAIVSILIDGGADVNLADHNGVTPLAHARQRRQRAVVERLEAANAR